MDHEFDYQESENLHCDGQSPAEPQQEDTEEILQNEVPQEQPAARFEPSSEYRWSRPVPPEEKPAEKPKKQKKGFSTGGIIALTLCCSLVAGVIGAGAMYLWGDTSDKNGKDNVSNVYQGDRESTVLNINHVDTSKLMTQAEVYAANVKSTVGITTSVTTNYWGYQTTTPASGSGFVYSKDGYILTNYHVIEDANSITVTTYDGSSLSAKVVGYDESNDIAVLKVEAENLTPVILGDSANMNVGDPVVAIGNPLGELTFSLTSGYISALNRQVTLSSGITMNLIQTDCAINSGNSGGALFNLYGEVVGITNAKYSGSSGSGASIDNIGFAIPINRVLSIVNSIIEKGYVVKPYIGVSVKDVSTETQSYGLPQGAAVVSVEENGPAQEYGLKVNDIVTHINGEAITGSADLKSIVTESAPGDVLQLTVWRKGATIELSITVGQQIQSGTSQEQNNQQNNQQSDFPFFNWGY